MQIANIDLVSSVLKRAFTQASSLERNVLVKGIANVFRNDEMRIQESPIDYLIKEFSREYLIKCETRPDSAIVLSLSHRADGCHVLHRVITASELKSPLLINDVLERMRRDLLVQQGPLQQSQIGYFHKKLQLPYF
ncbi:hypothetical protein D3C77_554280 [compost metagenome]